MEYSINNEFIAYFIGFVQTDGTITEQSRNRGRISIEINSGDRNLLEQMKEELNKLGLNATLGERTRDTQFKVDYQSVILRVFDLEFRQFISNYIPSGKKSDTVQFVKDIDSTYIKHYVRGLIDGDGSVGITSEGFPFVSFWTINESLAAGLENYFFKLTNKHRSLNRTKRDDGITIVYTKEEAQLISEELYRDADIKLDRKYKNYLELMKWQRPPDMKKMYSKKWDKEQDEYILNHTINESMQELGRTERSIKARLFRLTGSANGNIQINTLNKFY